MSALTRANTREVLIKTVQVLSQIPAELEKEDVPVYSVESDPNEFSISRISEGWKVSGASIERAAQMTYWEYDQSVRRFQRILQTLGINEALREAGVQEGDSVFIADFELEWME
jgi:GTP-binding protein